MAATFWHQGDIPKNLRPTTASMLSPPKLHQMPNHRRGRSWPPGRFGNAKSLHATWQPALVGTYTQLATQRWV
eukprot:999068-Amphidinium_carterae.1